MSALHDDFRAMVAQLRPSADTVALRRRAMVIEPVTRPAIARDDGAYARWVSTCSLCGDESTKQVCGRCSATLERTGL